MSITIDDVSPQFQYIAGNASNIGWFQDHSDDGLFGSYFQGTFYGTMREGDYMKLKFNGTAVAIYGAKRPNHGVYSIQLDGGSTSFQLGYSATDKLQQVLYQVSGLTADTEHELIMTNLPSQTSVTGSKVTEWWLDIDYAVITTSISGHQIYTTEIDDTSAAVQYFGSGWGTGPPQGTGYHDSTAHITKTVGDSAQFKFNGSSVQVFGGLYVDHGNYSVSIDGSQPQVFNATFYKLMPGASLYQASNLDDGPHTLVLTNLGQGSSGNFFDFDYAVVNSTINPATTSSNSSSSSSAHPVSASPSTSSSPSTATASAAPDSSGSGSGPSSNAGAIAAGVVGGIVGLALVAVLAWFLLRLSKQRSKDTGYVAYADGRGILLGDEVKPFPHHDSASASSFASASVPSGAGYAMTHTRDFSLDPTLGHSPLPPPPPHPPNGSDVKSSASAPGLAPAPAAFLTHIPAPPPSNTSSYPRSIYPFTGVGGGGGGGGGGDPTEQGDGGGGTRSSGKSMGVALPYTASPPQPPAVLSTPVRVSTVSSDTAGDGGRMHVPGREQDMGPLGAGGGGGVGGVGEGEGGLDYVSPPPNYSQATEPLGGQRGA